MKIVQRRIGKRTEFDFGPESVAYTVKDANGSRSFTLDYLDFDAGTGVVEEWNTWWRNVGGLWIAIGVVLVVLRAQRGLLPGAFWILLGAACLVVYRLGRVRSSYHDTPQGKVTIIKDDRHDAILQELTTRKKDRLRALHGEIDPSNSPEREIAKFKWLAEQGALTAEERDQRIAVIIATEASTSEGADPDAPHQLSMDPVEATILRTWKRIAVVGLSDRTTRPSYGVTVYMQEQGYTVLPVNPRLASWRGLPAWPDLASVPGPVEIVDVFRRSEHAGEVVDDAIRVGAKAIWLQEGVVAEEAARRAREAGLLVVMDRCMLKAHRALRS